MSVSATAHLNFRGNAREALTSYHSVFGGQIMIATYGDVGVPEDSPNADRAVFAPVEPDSPDADHVAFDMVAAENGLRLAAYDVFGTSSRGVATAEPAGASTRAAGLTHTETAFLLLNGEALEEITPLWDALGEDATVIQQLAPANWAPAYGMLTDRFGVTWIFGVTPRVDQHPTSAQLAVAAPGGETRRLGLASDGVHEPVVVHQPRRHDLPPA